MWDLSSEEQWPPLQCHLLSCLCCLLPKNNPTEIEISMQEEWILQSKKRYNEAVEIPIIFRNSLLLSFLSNEAMYRCGNDYGWSVSKAVINYNFILNFEDSYIQILLDCPTISISIPPLRYVLIQKISFISVSCIGKVKTSQL